MARQMRDNRLSTRDARAKLPATRVPLWHEIHRGLHLGYRKGRRTGAGHWYLREYRDGKLWQRRLGVADDCLDADGVTVFSWLQALRVAIGEDRPTVVAAAAYTVREALEDYWTFRRAKSPPHSVAVDQAKAAKVILPKLGSRDINELTAYELQGWRDRQVKPLSTRCRVA